MEEEIKRASEKIVQALALLREAIDISVTVKSKGAEANRQICMLWEGFLGDFFSYIRKKSKETKQNLLAGISFPRF